MTGLVLLHGFTGGPESFAEVVQRLRARRPGLRILSPWLLGHGPAPELGPRRFEAEVDRLAELIRTQRFTGAHLCGYSLGARVGLGLLARRARLFSAATLIGVNPGLASAAERAARVGGDERWAQLLLREGMTAFSAAWQAQPLFASQTRVPGSRLEQQRQLRNAHTADGLVRALRVLGLGQMPDYRAVFPCLRLRVRLLAGALDQKFLALAREMAALGDDTELECVPEAGHNLLLEAPEHVARVLTRALEAHP